MPRLLTYGTIYFPEFERSLAVMCITARKPFKSTRFGDEDERGIEKYQVGRIFKSELGLLRVEAVHVYPVGEKHPQEHYYPMPDRNRLYAQPFAIVEFVKVRD